MFYETLLLLGWGFWDCLLDKFWIKDFEPIVVLKRFLFFNIVLKLKFYFCATLVFSAYRSDVSKTLVTWIEFYSYSNNSETSISSGIVVKQNCVLSLYLLSKWSYLETGNLYFFSFLIVSSDKTYFTFFYGYINEISFWIRFQIKMTCFWIINLRCLPIVFTPIFILNSA